MAIGGMGRDPKKLQRLSPGVYRAADGGLVNSGGRAIQPSRQPQGAQPTLPGAEPYPDGMQNLRGQISPEQQQQFMEFLQANGGRLPQKPVFQPSMQGQNPYASAGPQSQALVPQPAPQPNFAQANYDIRRNWGIRRP